MRVCLFAPGPSAPGATAGVRRLAAALGPRHEVEVLEPPTARSEEVESFVFAGDAHRDSAALLEALRELYGETGPDYLEVCDLSPLGLVPLHARRGGDPLLASTVVGVRAWPSHELRSIHNRVLSQPQNRLRADLERDQLRLADVLLWPGGDVLDLYRRYYGAEGVELPEPVRARPPAPTTSWVSRGPRGEDRLRILYLGELERRLGVLDLVEACLGLPADDWELTLAGPDTETATMGQSARFTIEAMSGDDPRVRIVDSLRAAELSGHDLVVVPARVEAWSEAAALAVAVGLPVLATPVGGLVEQVEDGVTGWLATDLGAEPLRRALGALLDDPGRVAAVAASGAIARRREELADPAPLLAAYEQIAARVPTRRPAAVPAPPLVTGIVPYYGASAYVGDAVASLLGQTHPRIEVLIVNDGSFEPADELLDRLAEDPRVTVVTQPNSGEAAARNLAAVLAHGEYLVMLDADNILEPRFVERALAAFAHDPEIAYVTSWLRMVDEEGRPLEPSYGYAALGNGVDSDDQRNWDGDTLAMVPRRLFAELGYHQGPGGSMHSDWEFYRWLRREGRFGLVLPEVLARYRIREQSLLRGHSEKLQDWGWNESRDRNRQRGMQWVAAPPK
jgi:glycogen(starch) synthase